MGVSLLYHSMILLPLAFYLGVSIAQPVLTPLSDSKTYAYYDTYDAYASQELDVIGSEGFKAIKKMEVDLANVDCFWQLIMAEQVADHCIKMFTKVAGTEKSDYNDVDMVQL